MKYNFRDIKYRNIEQYLYLYKLEVYQVTQ